MILVLCISNKEIGSYSDSPFEFFSVFSIYQHAMHKGEIFVSLDKATMYCLL